MGFNPKKVRRRRHIRHTYDACGWLLYLAAWARVLPHTDPLELWSFGLIFLASVIFIHAGAAAWIGHNKRIARHGKRGLATRYFPPKFTTDHLDRQLHIYQDAYAASEVLVSVQGPVKFYAAANGMAAATAVGEALEVGAD